jgi:hypothetical protein
MKTKRGDIKRFREHLNTVNQNGVKHQHGRFAQRTRGYGDYLYAQDRDRFMMEFQEWIKTIAF